MIEIWNLINSPPPLNVSLKIAPPIEITRPCLPSPCGVNTHCLERNGAASCQCITDYIGDPYVECRPECVQNSDCSKSKACINQKCENPCSDICGQNAECNVLNHNPLCECYPGYTGNPMLGCHLLIPKCKNL